MVRKVAATSKNLVRTGEGGRLVVLFAFGLARIFER
jgi:hypothetical protein